MNQLTKLIKQKNTLLLFATCIAVSSLTLQCESCKSVPVKEDNKVTMKLTPASGIKDDEVATFKLQQTAGATILGDVVLTITNYAAFVTQDGRALAATMKLNEFLGKKVEEKMGDTAIDLSVKATTKTQAGTNDQKLKIAVGNNTDAAAYVSETDVVTWKAPIKGITLKTPSIIIHQDQPAEIELEKTGLMPLTYGEVLLTFWNFNKFVRVNPDGSEGSLTATMTLDVFLGKDVNAEIPVGTPIQLKVKANTTDETAVLSLAIGESGKPNQFLTKQDVVTAWNKPIKMEISNTSVVDIQEHAVATITLTNIGPPVMYGDLILEFGGYPTDFEAAHNRFITFDTNLTLSEFTELSKNVILGQNENVELKIKATDKTIKANAQDIQLFLRVKDKANNNITSNIQIIKWSKK